MCDGTWQVCSLVKLFSSSSHSQPIPTPISSPSTTLSLALAMAMLSLRSILDLPGAAARGTSERFLAWQRSCQENCRAESAEHFGRLHLALPRRLLHFLCAFEEGAHLSISHRIAPSHEEGAREDWMDVRMEKRQALSSDMKETMRAFRGPRPRRSLASCPLFWFSYLVLHVQTQDYDCLLYLPKWRYFQEWRRRRIFPLFLPFPSSFNLLCFRLPALPRRDAQPLPASREPISGPTTSLWRRPSPESVRASLNGQEPCREHRHR